MEPKRYRWDVYAGGHTPTEWRIATPGKLRRAFRAMICNSERIRVEFDNGQQVVYRRKPYTIAAS